MPLDCPDMRPERVCVLTRSMNDRFNKMEFDLTEIVCRGQTTRDERDLTELLMLLLFELLRFIPVIDSDPSQIRRNVRRCCLTEHETFPTNQTIRRST
jgi:hypothetical protein